MADIKSKLIPCLGIAQTLENGAALREAEAKVAALETALEKSESENSELKAQLETFTREVRTFREEQLKREQKEQKINPLQFQILHRLPSQGASKWLRIDEISRAVKIPLDEAEVYVEGLEKVGLVNFHYHEPGGGGWQRTAEGNRLVVAQRWAGESDSGASKQDVELSAIQLEALAAIAKAGEDGLTERQIARLLDKSLGLVRHILHCLRDAGMATDTEVPGVTFSVSRPFDPSEDQYSPTWNLLRNGENYLAKRGML